MLMWRARVRLPTVLLLAGVIAIPATLTGATGATAAEGSMLPGMCKGRTDPQTVITAHAPETAEVPKFILNVATDASTPPVATGVLILDKDGERLYVDQICRVWRHLPGQSYGQCGADIPEGATTVHAVGIGTLRDGTRWLVRTDARRTEEGMFFRVRYKAMGAGHEEEGVAPAAHEDGGCSGAEWIRVPAGDEGEHEGWAPLAQLKVQVGVDG